MNNFDPIEALSFALELASSNSENLMSGYLHPLVVRQDSQFTTAAELRSSAQMRARIEENYPDHGILTERGDKNPQAMYRWIVSSVDDSPDYIVGVPTFCTVISLLWQGEPILGVIHSPVLQRTVYATKDGGCWLRTSGSQLPTRVQLPRQSYIPLAEAIVLADCNSVRELAFLNSKVEMLRVCNGAMAPALVCRGRAHSSISFRAKPWTIAASKICVEEAGGIATDLRGNCKDIVFAGKGLIVSSNKALHGQILIELQRPRLRY